MKVKTTRFGTLEVSDNVIISFPHGLPGFENLRRFFILPVEGTEDIHWLQSAEEPAVALLVVDPFKFFQGYVFDIPEPDIEGMEIKESSETLVLTTVTIPRDNPAGATANLVAPIIINTRLNKGKQLILTGSNYTTKHRLFPTTNASLAPQEKEKVFAGEGV